MVRSQEFVLTEGISDDVGQILSMRAESAGDHERLTTDDSPSSEKNPMPPRLRRLSVQELTN